MPAELSATEMRAIQRRLLDQLLATSLAIGATLGERKSILEVSQGPWGEEVQVPLTELQRRLIRFALDYVTKDIAYEERLGINTPAINTP
jgi:hypothetical protein